MCRCRGPTIGADDLQALFEQVYFRRFRVDLPEIRANVVNANSSVIGLRAALDLSALIDPAGRQDPLAEAQIGTRPVHFDGTWHDTPVYWRDHLPLEVRAERPGDGPSRWTPRC